MTERAELFGHDLELAGTVGAVSAVDVGADLAASPAGDLRLTTGEQNIVQALAMRLRVRREELARLGYPTYGSRLHEMVGQPNNERTRVQLMAHARTAIEADPRVAEVRGVTATVLPGERDVVRLSLDVLLISTPNPLNLVHDVRLGSVTP
jgi:phage baseplate assembly protein W